MYHIHHRETRLCSKIQISNSVQISLSNCGHCKKTTRQEFQLFCVLGCILRSPVCDDEHCLIFKDSHLSAILFDGPVLKNACLAVELENEIIRLTHQSFSVPTSMKRYFNFLDRFVSWYFCDALNRLVSQTTQLASDHVRIYLFRETLCIPCYLYGCNIYHENWHLFQSICFQLMKAQSHLPQTNNQTFHWRLSVVSVCQSSQARFQWEQKLTRTVCLSCQHSHCHTHSLHVLVCLPTWCVVNSLCPCFVDVRVLCVICVLALLTVVSLSAVGINST